MGETYIKLVGTKVKTMKELSETLKSELDAELVNEVWRTSEYMDVLLLVFEKFYFRNGSYASLSIMLTESTEIQTADIVGSGGGANLMNFSFGANSNLTKNASKILEKYKFSNEEQECCE